MANLLKENRNDFANLNGLNGKKITYDSEENLRKGVNEDEIRNFY